jgi:hypothetical protein
MSRSTFFILISFILLSTADAATVRTRDGKAFDGTITLRDDKLVVTGADGKEQAVSITDVAHARFRDDPVTPHQPPPPPSPTKIMDKPRPKKGHGLRGEYFDRDFHAIKQIRMDANIDFDVPDEEYPGLLIPKDFAARWTGQIQPAHSERYTFHVQTHSPAEKARLWIDGRLIIDHWNAKGDLHGSIDLKADQKYDLKLEYVDDMFWGRCRLSWQSKSQSKDIIPPERLYAPKDETNARPTVRISSPANDVILTDGGKLKIEADCSDEDGEVRKIHFFLGDTLLGATETSPFSIETHVRPGPHELRVLATDDRGMTETSEPVRIIVGADARGGFLPSPWVQMSVGKRGTIGETKFDNGRFTLEGFGGDLWGERDQFHFVYQPLDGDDTIVARVVRFDPAGDIGEAAGIALREDLNKHNSRQAFLGVTPDAGVEFLRREQEWESRKSNLDKASLPRWVKLSRHERAVRAYHSADGEKWTFMGERRIEMPARVYAGLAIASAADDGKDRSRALFDNVRLERGSPKMLSAIKGLILRDGSIVVADIHRADDTSVRFSAFGRETTVPTSHVARILYRPLSEEAAARIPPGRTGVVLGSGDFIDGDVAIRDGHVTISSVLFGVRRFNTYDQTTAIILRDAAPAATNKHRLRATDGSVLNISQMIIERGKLRATDPAGNVFALTGEQLVEIVTGDDTRPPAAKEASPR